ncbi:L-lactate permease [Rhodovastum atsumiense]|uniref:L-lactate permease n=2 Tax=Rhodovastum atsumiense TaxID=504468 RepID=A0A5M6J2W1_9PROT|nr:L-lactate permease [Rhodovastum atsumiense]
MYQQVYAPIAGSLGLSSAFAALPLVTMFVLLGGLRWSPHVAGLCSLLVAGAVAVLAYGMPLDVTLNTAAYGAAFSILPIILIVINAIWIQNMMVRSGKFEVLRRTFGVLSNDLRVQAIIIAFCFGALLEALAGAGTPIAIAAVMLVALGMDPLKAAVCALAADTAPVAFGALAVPITTLAAVTGEPFELLGAIVGRQTPVISVFVPLVLVWIVDGRRGIRQVWPAALVSGLSFGIAQFVCSNYISVQLSDVLAALVGAGMLVGFLQVWQPDETVEAQIPLRRAQPVGAAVASDAELARADSTGDRLLAFLPYVAIIVIFTLAQIGAVDRLLSVGLVKFPWPDLHILNGAGKPVGTMLALPLLSGTAPLLLLAGLLTAPFLGLSAGETWRAYRETLWQMRWMVPTVFFVLAVAFVMNLSGQTITLGRWLANTGHAFAFLSGAIGWIGVAITGSDNSSNALFGAMQVAAAKETGLSPALLAAANSAGGVLGKMISPQSLAIGAAAVGIIGREGDIFRASLFWSVVLTLALCLLVWLQATPVLSWMLP